MPFFNLQGGKEASGENSEKYKKKIERFMELNGYYKIQDSKDFATTADMKFARPQTEGSTPIWVEAKWDDVGRYDKRFLTELGRYFIEYASHPESERFDLYIFVRYCSAVGKWRHIFDAKLRRKDAVSDLFEKLREKNSLESEELEKIDRLGLVEFRQFITDCYVFQVDYQKLLMEIETMEDRGDRHKIKDYYLKERDPINATVDLTANFSEIESYPEKILGADIAANSDRRDIDRNIPDQLPWWESDSSVYTTLKREDLPEGMRKHIVEGTIEHRDFETWAKKNSKNDWIARNILTKQLRYQALNLHPDCVYDGYDGGKIFFEHQEEQVKKEIGGRQVSKYFETSSPPAYKHMAVEPKVKTYGTDFFVFLAPCVIFTRNGRDLITGKTAKKLHDKLVRKDWENNGTVRREFEFWNDFFCLTEADDSQDLVVGDPISETMHGRPPKTSKEREKIHKTADIGDFV